MKQDTYISRKGERDNRTDFLRFIGISLIILAHVNPPEFIFQFRCFDVPLMVFISGLLYGDRTPDFSRTFFVKRFKRLVIPLYVFLSCYFLLAFLMKKLVKIDFGIQIHHIIDSYLLMGGIGFVWIIRVFLMIGLLTPVLLWINSKIHNNYLFWTIVFGALATLDIVINNGYGMENIAIREFLFYAIGYGMIFLTGVRIKSNRYSIYVPLLVTFCITFFTLWMGINIEDFKNPPRLIFCCYGIMMSSILYIITNNYNKNIKLISFIGKNTLWIYLIHIPLLQLARMFELDWFLQYLSVYSLSVLFIFIQYIVVDKLTAKYNWSFLKYFVG